MSNKKSFFELSVEELTLVQPITVRFDANFPDTVTFYGQTSQKCFKATAYLPSKIEFLPCDNIENAECLLLPLLSFTTLDALLCSSFANTLLLGLSSNDFANQFKVRVEKLLQ